MSSIPRVISFRASDMPADQVGGLVAEYLALQRWQVFRRLVVVRLLVLAAVASGAARLSGLLSPAATALLAAIFAVPAAVVWIAEIAAKQRLGRLVARVPHSTIVSSGATDESSPSLRKVIKSS